MLDAGRHSRAARSGPSPVSDLCVHAGCVHPDSPRPHSESVHQPRLGQTARPVLIARPKQSGRPGAGLPGLRGWRGLGAVPAAPHFNHEGLQVAGCTPGRGRQEKPSTQLLFPSSHPPRSYLLPLPEWGVPREHGTHLPLHMGTLRPGRPRTLPRPQGPGREGSCGVGLSWFGPSPTAARHGTWN